MDIRGDSFCGTAGEEWLKASHPDGVSLPPSWCPGLSCHPCQLCCVLEEEKRVMHLRSRCVQTISPTPCLTLSLSFYTPGPLAAVLADIEQLKASADALELELTAASEVAAVAAKRSRRLAARSHELQVISTSGDP